MNNTFGDQITSSTKPFLVDDTDPFIERNVYDVITSHGFDPSCPGIPVSPSDVLKDQSIFRF